MGLQLVGFLLSPSFFMSIDLAVAQNDGVNFRHNTMLYKMAMRHGDTIKTWSGWLPGTDGPLQFIVRHQQMNGDVRFPATGSKYCGERFSYIPPKKCSTSFKDGRVSSGDRFVSW